MDGLRLKTSHFVSRPDPTKVLISAISLPLSREEGTVFSLIKILGKPDVSRQRIVTIIEDHMKRLQQTMTEHVNVARRFEQVLQAINEDIFRAIREEQKIPLSDFHGIVGISLDRQIFLSGIGNLSALFLHRTAKQRYAIYELDKQFVPADASWEKPFLTVLDGELVPGDVFYVGTRLTNRELTMNDLQDILVTLPASGALKRVQQHVQVNAAYGGVVIQMIDKKPTGQPKKMNPFSSIEQLGNTKSETAELLGEQAPDVAGWLTRLTKPMLDALSTSGQTGLKSTVTRLLRLLIKSIIAFLAFLTVFARQTTIFAKKIWLRLQSQKKSALASDPRPQRNEAPKARLQHAWKTVVNLPASTKLLGLATAMTFLIFLGSVSFINTSSSKREAQASFDAIVTRIEEKKNAAEASLIYDDKAQARTLLEEAVLLLEQLPADSRENETQINTLREDINSVFYTLRGVTEVDLTTLANTDASFAEVVEANGAVFGITLGNDVYRLNELELRFDPVPVTKGSIGNMVAATGEGSNLLFVDDAPRLGRLDTTTNAMNPVVSGVEALAKVSDITLYNGNLYALAPESQQIVKMQTQAGGFDGGTNWITSLLSPFRTAISLAIDGDVYVLTAEGILRFSAGREVTFQFEAVDPPLLNAKALWTTVGTDYVYVLDPAEARVVVYNKTGILVAQYVDEALRGGKSLIVREDKAHILVGTDSSVLQFTANHLID